MSERNSVVRSPHDLGPAVWLGGSSAGAVGINGALRVANTGWARWTPVNAAAIAAHLIGGVGVGASTVAKLVLTAAAVGVTAYSGVLLDACQWLIPALTGLCHV